FGLVTIVGVGRAEFGGHLGVGFGPGILIFYQQTDWCAEGLSFEGPGQNLDFVEFLPWRDNSGLAWTPTVEIRLNIGLSQLQLWRAAIHDHADSSTVRFSPGGDAEKMAERVSHEQKECGKTPGGSMARRPLPCEKYAL